jgi:TfoX/Sxy family transcriptional regulator of competence genes
MEILKPTDADKDYFKAIVPEDPRVEVKPMFGNLAAFVNGNMFMGLFGPKVGVRLADDDRVALEALGGVADFGPAGRPMKEYISMPDDWRTNPAQTERWTEAALVNVAAMPPKKPKAKK